MRMQAFFSTPQRRTTLALVLIGLVYFAIFVIPNAHGARNVNMLRVFSNDETITYPYVLHMLATPKDIHDFVWRMLIYGDYHYGYPFYFFSMLTVLPVKGIFGEAFAAHTQLNVLLLRQFISVLPMLLAAGVLVFAQTRFHSTLRSVLLFALLLAIPGVVRNNLWWWHPDALAVLCVALTLLFLCLDRLRLGKWFWWAAVSCALATAIKLVGFFFVFALAGYVLAAWRGALRRAGHTQFYAPSPTPRGVALRALGFVLVMATVIVLANPFLFYSSQRAKLVRIQAEKSVELSQGYTHDDPTYYQKGLRWWVPTLTQWYGSIPFLALLLGLVILGSLHGVHTLINRLILAWVVPYSVYLLYFVAVKPDHYWLPVMLPLFSGALNGIPFHPLRRNRRMLGLITLLLALVLAWQAVVFFRVDIGLWITIMGMEAAKGYAP